MQALRHRLSWNASFHDVLETWRQLLGLFAKTLQLPPSHARLIVHCKNAAMRVSRSVWEEICQRMLNPPA
ncbi:hypothetical protein ACN28S_40430 [Cystobacter fuscus]